MSVGTFFLVFLYLLFSILVVLEHFGERRYECDGVFVPTQVSVPIPWGVLRFGVVWGDAVQWDAMPCDGMRC